MAQLYDAFVANVRDRMAALGMSQKDLAAELKVTKGYVSQILGGHAHPGLESLERFALALKCDAADLIRTQVLQRSA